MNRLNRSPRVHRRQKVISINHPEFLRNCDRVRAVSGGLTPARTLGRAAEGGDRCPTGRGNARGTGWGCWRACVRDRGGVQREMYTARRRHSRPLSSFRLRPVSFGSVFVRVLRVLTPGNLLARNRRSSRQRSRYSSLSTAQNTRPWQ
jgi:hypothetical protein